ncbi:MAG: carbamoyltransferase HypF [Desulfovermiculus sp.]|nr:carbamoyltransferase HypF [Desulfovermiculus sp.]
MTIPPSPPPTLRLIITGRVQGVGFRPFVYRLAQDLGVCGQVRNTPRGVEIMAQGDPYVLLAFPQRLQAELPEVAEITGLERSWLEDHPPFQDFRIQSSTPGQGHDVLISPDIATCPACQAEIRDLQDPRYMYPFTNCTNCGPRYTITARVPYDRSCTSMACFPMCTRCQEEYHDPGNRRFHAQPNACPVCGPSIWSTAPDGTVLDNGDQALNRAAETLSQGNILAFKGLGGFHLACLAFDPRAVQCLRQRKKRPGKPLALMVPDLDTAADLAHLTPTDRDWLTGGIHPILLAPKRRDAGLPDNLAPDTDSIGLMLPYTPLHLVLFALLQDRLGPDMPPALVMTSGNAGSEPIALGNREALDRLASIADLFLLHNRDILVRCDDSVLRTLPGRVKPLVFRRARGFVPSPIRISLKGPSVLGLGPEQKTTVCLTKGNQAFVSQHIGDLHNLATYAYYQQTLQHLQDILQTSPRALITDLHPDFLSTRFAGEQKKLPVYALQHHVAHILAVSAENACQEPVLGLALDGTGLGQDRTLWGGELLYVHPRTLEYRRLGHFSPMLLPGGEQAVVEPWRTAQSMLFAQGIFAAEGRRWPWLEEYARASEVIGQMLDKKMNCVLTTSCGRLFDAVSALLGLCQRIEYEAQAAVRLENMQTRDEDTAYLCPWEVNQDMSILDTAHLFAQVHADWLCGTAPECISRRFHLGLIQGLADWTLAVSRQTGLKRIALSGGVMQNATLARRLPAMLEKQGLTPLTHRFLPPNDACISLGQAVYGQTLLSRGL